MTLHLNSAVLYVSLYLNVSWGASSLLLLVPSLKTTCLCCELVHFTDSLISCMFAHLESFLTE